MRIEEATLLCERLADERVGFALIHQIEDDGGLRRDLGAQSLVDVRVVMTPLPTTDLTALFARLHVHGFKARFDLEQGGFQFDCVRRRELVESTVVPEPPTVYTSVFRQTASSPWPTGSPFA